MSGVNLDSARLDPGDDNVDEDQAGLPDLALMGAGVEAAIDQFFSSRGRNRVEYPSNIDRRPVPMN